MFLKIYIYINLKLSVFPFSVFRVIMQRSWWTLDYFCVSFLELQRPWIDIQIQELYDKICTYIRAMQTSSLLYYLLCSFLLSVRKTNSKVSVRYSWIIYESFTYLALPNRLFN